MGLPHLLINFLQAELSIPVETIPGVLEQCGSRLDRLPVVLWQQRLVNLSQLDRLFVWLDWYRTNDRTVES